MEFEDPIPKDPVRRYVAGVDPGTHTAIAVYDREVARILFLCSTDFFGVVPWFTRHIRISELEVFVEVSPAVRIAHGIHDEETRDKILVNTGGVRREAQLLAELLRRSHFKVREVAPVRQEKWTLEKFQQMTHCFRAANEHERDAARIALIYATKKESNGKTKRAKGKSGLRRSYR